MKKTFCLAILSLFLVLSMSSCAIADVIYVNMLRTAAENKGPYGYATDKASDKLSEKLDEYNAALTIRKNDTFRVLKSCTMGGVPYSFSYDLRNHCVTMSVEESSEGEGRASILVFVNNEGAVTTIATLDPYSREQDILFEESNEDIETTLNSAGWIQEVEYWHTQKFIFHYDNYVDNNLTEIEEYYYDNSDGWGHPYVNVVDEYEEDAENIEYTTISDNAFKLFKSVGWLMCMLDSLT